MYEFWHLYTTFFIAWIAATAVCFVVFDFSTKKRKNKHDYYILKMWNLIEPILLGPFEFNECQEKLEAYREDPEQSQNSFTEIRVSKGAELDV